METIVTMKSAFSFIFFWKKQLYFTHFDIFLEALSSKNATAGRISVSIKCL